MHIRLSFTVCKVEKIIKINNISILNYNIFYFIYIIKHIHWFVIIIIIIKLLLYNSSSFHKFHSIQAYPIPPFVWSQGMQTEIKMRLCFCRYLLPLTAVAAGVAAGGKKYFDFQLSFSGSGDASAPLLPLLIHSIFCFCLTVCCCCCLALAASLTRVLSRLLCAIVCSL